MKCLMCSQEFNIKRGFNNVFSFEKAFICNKCRNDKKLKLEINEVPLKNHLLKVISAIDYNKYQNNLAYVKEMSAIREKLKALLKNDYSVIDDDFILTKDAINEYEMMSEILDKDIVVIANTYRL